MTDVDVRTLVREFWVMPFDAEWDVLAEEIVALMCRKSDVRNTKVPNELQNQTPHH